MISANQARIGNETKAVVQAAEAQATQAATSAQQQAETVASALTMQSITSSMTSTGTSSSTNAKATQTQDNAFALPAGVSSTTSSIEAIRPPTQVTITETTQSTGTGLSMPSTLYQFNLSTSQSTTVAAVESPVLNFGFQLPSGRTLTQTEPDTIQQNEGIKVGSRSTLNDAIEQRPMLQSATTQEQKTDAVNKNVQPNELAGGVDLSKMAIQPQGYQAYSMMMPDVAFYAPKEIYKNQVNVDNARTLRSLLSGSDRLHQEMVNQQYKLGN
jgi:hypothetical protein